MNSAKKKICYVLPSYSAADHTHFAHIVDLVVQASRQADIFLLIEKTAEPIQESALKEKFGASRIEIINSQFGFFKYWLDFFALLKIRLAGWRDFYVHYSFLSAFNASLITKLFGGRVFYWNCGLPWQYRRSFLREQFERAVYHLIDFLVTGTPSLVRQYAKNYCLEFKKVKVMPNWISLEKFKSLPLATADDLKKELNILPADKVLLFWHRLSKRKGAHLLPQIFRKISLPNVKLLIGGDGPERQFLEQELLEEIASGKVKLLGWVPQNEAAKYYAIADIFLLPSEEEGFPRVILEAMAAGLPFVAFDAGGIKEIIPPQFLQNIAPARNLEKFCDLVNNQLSVSQPEISFYKDTARSWVKKYETAQVAENFLELFN